VRSEATVLKNSVSFVLTELTATRIATEMPTAISPLDGCGTRLVLEHIELKQAARGPRFDV
jgi:hypothetical protein